MKLNWIPAHSNADTSINSFLPFLSTAYPIERRVPSELFSRVYRRLFVLPPVSERRMVEGQIKKIFYPHLRKESNDTYIYYLVMKNSFFVAAFFSALYWVSYAFGVRFDFLLFSIYVEQTDFVRSISWSYPFVVWTVLLVIFIPYAWLLFRENVNLNTCDLLAWNKLIPEETKRDRKKLVRLYRFVLLPLLLGMYGGFALPEMILKYKIHSHLATSNTFYLIVLAFYTCIYSGALSGLVICAAGYWQHWKGLGPRYRKQNLQ